MNLLLRILMATVLMTGCAANAAAQSKIKDITIRPDVFDLTASTSQRLDNNGNPCGLLKVSVAVDNVEFQGNVIGDVVRHGGAYWVYVTNGTKKIRMTSAAFGDVDLLFADWNIPHIQSKTTYTVSVEMAETAGNAAPAKRGYVQFTLTPTNAFIVFNGQQLDVTGGTAYKLVPYGNYNYTVQAAGYEPYAGTVNVNAGQVQVPVKLRSNKASVTVTAETPGSRIYVDGALKGNAPWHGELMPGDYIVEARREGYRSREVTVTLTAASERNVAIPALEIITGELSIEYQPFGAQIALDGKAMGTTPTLLADIPAGSHTLAISHSGYDTATLSVTVSENGTTPVTGTLTKTSASGPAAQSGTTSTAGAQPQFSTSPINMALCAKGPDGYVYITADQWKKLSESQKSAFKPLGVYLAAGDFLVELHDKENGKEMNWNAAMKYNLPIKEQGQILVDNKTALNNALNAFGGTVMDDWYWTKTEYNSSNAWYFFMDFAGITTFTKTSTGRVRAVAPVPDPAAGKDVAAIRNEMAQAYNSKYYRKARELALTIPDDAYAQIYLGAMYKKGYGVSQDYTEAVNWYRKAAEQGDAIAQSNLGDMYYYGYGVPKDYAQAVNWYRKAAEQGQREAQNNLGEMYYCGYGVDKDYALAMNWFRKAAEQGQRGAQHNLGMMYEKGYGVPKDYAQAVNLYRKAAEQGQREAQYKLGFMYHYGYGMTKDINEARRWYEKAAAQGHRDAEAALKRLGQ